MSFSDNSGSNKIPGKTRAESHQAAHDTHTEWLEGTFSAWAEFWEDRRENAHFLCEGSNSSNSSSL